VSEQSAISWTQATWNPTTGCDRVSPGCANCYALAMAKRLKAAGNPRYQKDGGPASGPGFGLTVHPDLLDLPLRWKKPRLVFVDSMSDLFHEDVPDAFIDRIFATMAGAEQHTFQVLTKRPERMRAYVSDWVRGTLGPGQAGPVLPNVWLGVSVENQHWADERIPVLQDTPAAVRFLSCEPLLGPLDVRHSWLACQFCDGGRPEREQLHRHPNPGISWVICGGESGAMSTRGGPERALVERCDGRKHGGFGCEHCGLSGWRPKPQALAWVRSLRDQCVAAGVPFFFKQWPMPPSKSGGPALIDGKEWRQMPDA